MPTFTSILVAIILVTATFINSSSAQPVTERAPQILSVDFPEVSSDRHVTFRIYAPNAKSILVTGPDIPGKDAQMTKGTNGIWEAVIGPIESPGPYRYCFNLDGVPVIDPRNPKTSESNEKVWSLLYVPGADFMDVLDVPHGAVATVTYYSKSLQQFRRMHVYTPPGYELGKGKYPVFYLLHGSGDCDDAWTSVGRAGFILDNLIASKKARPMVVVMPAGHIRASDIGSQGDRLKNEFIKDFLYDIMPYAETHYRINTDRGHRAIAGLSMGGAQTLNIAIPHLDKFGYVGVFSAGLFRNRDGTNTVQTWEQQHVDDLDNPKLKNGLKLFWFSIGKDDPGVESARLTAAMFKQHGFEPVFNETSGWHSWINWRIYLNQFAPLLFQ